MKKYKISCDILSKDVGKERKKTGKPEVMKRIGVCLLCVSLIGAGTLTGCEKKISDDSNAANSNETTNDSVTSDSSTADSSTADGIGEGNSSAGTKSSINVADMFTDRDLDGSYDKTDAVRITLQGSSASCDSEGVHVEEGAVTITKAGTYLVTGTLENGTLIVDADKSDKVQIILKNAQITSDDSAALSICQADKVFVTLAEGSQNHLSSTGTFEKEEGDDNIDGAVFSRDDLTFNGSGSLVIASSEGHGIVGKDDLVITGGSYEITAAKHGLSANDSIRITNADLDITSGKDGMHTKENEDEEKGFIYLKDGIYTITAAGDGISAGSELLIEDGSYHIVTRTQSSAAHSSAASNNGTQSKMSQNGDRKGNMKQSSTTTDDASTKGLKAEKLLIVTGGEFQINSTDDSIHCNGSIEASGGSFELATGDDGFHADEALTITGGTIQITDCYEGLEGCTVTITGGDIRIVADDDGLNAASRKGSDNPFAADENCNILIAGGNLVITAGGDGIDSNGNLQMTGGNVMVNGSSDSANGALDYNGSAVITGGVIVALGTSGMAQNFGEDSTQGSMLVSVGSQSAGSEMILSDDTGKELMKVTAVKAYDSVLISMPELTQGKTYQLTAGTYSGEITMETLIYGSGMGGFGGFGGFGGGKGGGSGRGSFGKDGSENGELPDGMNPPDGKELPEGMTPPNGKELPEGMTPPNGKELPEGMTPPDGKELPEGMTPPDGKELPGGTSPADGTEPSAGSGQI